MFRRGSGRKVARLIEDLVRPAGRSYLEVKVLYGPGKGNR
jgi:hypothetical protein